MDALYQVRVRKGETDLAIDQLRETLRLLAAERAPGISKLEKRLEEVGLTGRAWSVGWLVGWLVDVESHAACSMGSTLK
jgi:hypothetical protein